MLSIKHIKKLLENQNISEKEAEEIRDAFYMLAEIIFEEWQKEKMKTKQKPYLLKYIVFKEENVL